MSETLQSVDLVFVTSIPSETEALLKYLRLLHSETAPVQVTDMSVDDALGVVSSEKIISVVLAFALNIGGGVIGNVIYNALQVAPSCQCVIGDTPVSQGEATDKAALEAKMRSAAKQQ